MRSLVITRFTFRRGISRGGGLDRATGGFSRQAMDKAQKCNPNDPGAERLPPELRRAVPVCLPKVSKHNARSMLQHSARCPDAMDPLTYRHLSAISEKLCALQDAIVAAEVQQDAYCLEQLHCYKHFGRESTKLTRGIVGLSASGTHIIWSTTSVPRCSTRGCSISSRTICSHLSSS